MTALDASQRTRLERLVGEARRTLEQDLAEQAASVFGVYQDGTLQDEAALHLDPASLSARREIVEIVEHLTGGEAVRENAVTRLVREASFTHLNRLVAIRIAEAMELLPESLGGGQASRGFRDVLELAPLLGTDSAHGYWTYLQLCGDELAADAPLLFDPRNPLLALAPGPVALGEVVGLLADPQHAPVWSADDTLGWAYQFFNTAEERSEMRESPAPRNSRELAVRNQFFTPRYVVDFLTQNTLGRRLLEADPGSPLLEHLPLLVDPPAASGPPLELAEATVLDPACGSGHFLLGAYDLLERAWQLRGVAPADAAPRIVSALWGVDIDPRCAQVASAAIVLRARRYCRGGELPRPNIITARDLPIGTNAMEDLLTALPADRRDLVRYMGEALGQAPVLGPLLKVESRLAEEIRRYFTGTELGEGTLAAGIKPDAFGTVESEVLAALEHVADAASSSAAERLLAAEAGDAIRFIDAMRRRHDVVLMNPPFGEPVPETKEYLRAAYPWIPTRDHNLLAVFVGRGLELCKADGYLGAVTSRAGLFQVTYEKWRREVLLKNRLVTLADLGFGVMEQALVEAAAYVVGATVAAPDGNATFVRLLKETDRPASLADAVAAHRAGAEDTRVNSIRLSELEAIPGTPLAYWMSPSMRRLFAECLPLEGHGAEARVGLQTGDDFRFVRAAWEVNPACIASSRDQTKRDKRWVPFAKGGAYSPFWADIHLVVDWENDGESLRSSSKSRVQNVDHYFRAGLTWPRRTASGFSPRALPKGCIFSDKGPAAFRPAGEPWSLLAWLTSRFTTVLLDAMLAAGDETTSGTASKSYEVGHVQKLPWPLDGQTANSLAAEAGYDCAALTAQRDDGDETTRRFRAPWFFLLRADSITNAALARLEQEESRSLEIISQSLDQEHVLADVIGVNALARQYVDEEVGPHPGALPTAPLANAAEFAELFQRPIDDVIATLIAEQGGARAIATKTYMAERRLEVLAHGLGRHPTVLIEARREQRLLPPEEPRSSTDDLFSYLVGVALGHWDVRVGQDHSRAPNAPDLVERQPVCSPGMLVDDSGLPPIAPPDGYPLSIPSARMLVDEPGHRWDVEAAILRAAAALLGDPDDIVDEMLSILNQKSIRDHLRKGFFKDHLSRYSKSRRKAPVYWPLTVPSRSWGVWVYAPVFSRETLFAIGGEAARREQLAKTTIARLSRERQTGGSGRSAKQVSQELAGEQALAEELGVFRAEAERVAVLGWEPNLDDGAVLCAAPLADLFPMWSEAAKYRNQLKAGKYPWATVAEFAERL